MAGVVLRFSNIFGAGVLLIRLCNQDDTNLWRVFFRIANVPIFGVKRNLARFPADFMFELTENEVESLVSQSVIPSKKQFGGAKPFVFTEQGVSSLSAVLTSDLGYRKI